MCRHLEHKGGCIESVRFDPKMSSEEKTLQETKRNEREAWRKNRSLKRKLLREERKAKRARTKPPSLLKDAPDAIPPFPPIPLDGARFSVSHTFDPTIEFSFQEPRKGKGSWGRRKGREQWIWRETRRWIRKRYGSQVKIGCYNVDRLSEAKGVAVFNFVLRDEFD
ncbi:hypothetical protein BGX38DRAFT_1259579, partial [Terfezia claveryi]